MAVTFLTNNVEISRKSEAYENELNFEKEN